MKDKTQNLPLETSDLSLPCVILDRPQLAENIGSVARVMANFGLIDLRLVAPRDGWPQDKAWTFASGAVWPLEGAKLFSTVAKAVADLHIVYATTARNRETQLPVITPRQCADHAHDIRGQGLRTGFLFGAERAGLETNDLGLCHYIVTIPVDPRFSSLNLAQAVNIVAYEFRQTVDANPSKAFTDPLDPPAKLEALQGLYAHLEDELDKGGFFFPFEKRDQMVRNLRITLNRANLTEQEIRTWRGVITALTKGRGRVLEKIAKLKDQAPSQ
jgi:tRNA/rRNA methyltransferase